MNAEMKEKYIECLRVGDLKGAKLNKPLWHEFIKAVYNQDGTYFFPALLTEKFLEEKKRILEMRGEIKLFASWYLMTPTIEGEELFLQEYKQWGDFVYNAYPSPQLQRIEDGVAGAPFPVNIYMRIDPSITSKESSHK